MENWRDIFDSREDNYFYLYCYALYNKNVFVLFEINPAKRRIYWYNLPFKIRILHS